MAVLAFVSIVISGEARFIEPNLSISLLELVLFIAGGAANFALALKLARE